MTQSINKQNFPRLKPLGRKVKLELDLPTSETKSDLENGLCNR